MTSQPPEAQVPLTPALPVAAKHLPWLERLSRYRQPIGLGVTLVLFAMALIACRHLLSELDIYALHDAMLSVPTQSLLGALLATLVGFVILLGYEWSASRFAGVKLPARSLVLGGFSAFAIGNAIGLSMLSGGSVRYRLYARQGLGAGEVARMTVFASLSLGCALPPLAALATLSDLQAASTALGLSTALLASIASAVLVLSTLLVIGLYRRRLAEQPLADSLLVQLGRRTLRLPSARLAALQLLITALDVAAAATVLYLLLPEAPPFGAFILVYLLALAAGVLSHVPGGVGVFEAILLAAFANQLGAAPLAAALLLYRLIYVVLPLLLACVLLLANEAKRLLLAQQAIKAASGLAAPILSILVFLSGVVLLFSGATPE
ncbi:MAG: lysylphosphatidylglycerol synthase domain-containing protein, partial [Pseudomonas sp.]